MKTPNFILAPLVAAVCCVSCSSPEERAEDTILSFAEDLEEIFSENRTASMEEIIDEVHDYVTDNTSGVLSDLSKLTDSQKARLVKNLHKQKAFDDLSSISERVIKEKMPKRSNSPEKLWKQLPVESRVKVVETATCLAKIFVTLCFNGEVISEL